MAKNTPTKTIVRKPADDELRRWCIEQAIRWPTFGGNAYAGVATQGGYVPVQEADILSRAARILKWVTGE